VSCRHNNFFTVKPSGKLRPSFPDSMQPWDVPSDVSCDLDVAARGGITLEEIAAILGFTRQRIQQIEGDGKDRFRRSVPRLRRIGEEAAAEMIETFFSEGATR
jgi:hypothetical protein